MRVGIDIDGVLMNWADSVVRLFNSYGARLTEFGDEGPPTWDTLEESAQRHWDFMWEIDRSVLYRSYRNGLPFPGVLESFDRLNKNHPTFLVTSRPRDAAAATYDWLKFHAIVPAGVIHVGDSKLKRGVLEGLGVTHFIDDKASTVLEVAENKNINTFLKDARYNRHIEYPNRVPSFGAFVDRLIGPKANKPQG